MSRGKIDLKSLRSDVKLGSDVDDGFKMNAEKRDRFKRSGSDYEKRDQKRVETQPYNRENIEEGYMEEKHLSNKLQQIQRGEIIHHSRILSLSSASRVFSYIAKTSGLNTSHLATAVSRILSLQSLESRRRKLSAHIPGILILPSIKKTISSG